MATEFYLVLPSNISKHIYRNNRNNDFRTLLSKEIRLNDTWEVALADVIYPCSWQNQINTPETRFIVRNVSISGSRSWVDLHIPSSHYHNTRAILAVMIRQLTENNIQYIQIQHDTSLDVFVVDMKKFSELVLTPELAESLAIVRQNLDGTYTVKDIYKALPDTKFDFDTVGFLHILAEEDVKIEIDPNVLPLQHKFVNFDVGTFQVESDIVTPIITGLKKLPILRRFKPMSCAQAAIRQEFTQLQYREVRKKRFQSLRIVINTGEGQPVPFASGISIVTLHFRRKKQDVKANV